MGTGTLYPTIEEQNTYKKIMKKHGLTESALMRNQPTQLYNNLIVVTKRALSTKSRKGKRC
jgi:hypothetical protein